MLRIAHVQGEAVYPSNHFRIDDGSGVLIVFRDPDYRHALAAFNREFWVHVEFCELEADGDGERPD